MPQDHRLFFVHGFNYNVEQWLEGDGYETPWRAAFATAVRNPPGGS
jgi:hypothetical protein